jgi:hemerythrin-like domain-containing protein
LPVPLYELENHHRRFDSLFSDPALGVEALESVLDDIYRHIAVEEYDLFPEVARSLSSQSVGSRT